MTEPTIGCREKGGRDFRRDAVAPGSDQDGSIAAEVAPTRSAKPPGQPHD